MPRRTPARDAPVERGIPRRGDGRVGRQALEVLIPGVVARTGGGLHQRNGVVREKLF